MYIYIYTYCCLKKFGGCALNALVSYTMGGPFLLLVHHPQICRPTRQASKVDDVVRAIVQEAGAWEHQVGAARLPKNRWSEWKGSQLAKKSDEGTFWPGPTIKICGGKDEFPHQRVQNPQDHCLSDHYVLLQVIIVRYKIVVIIIVEPYPIDRQAV